jgi:hypothetical protein
MHAPTHTGRGLVMHVHEVKQEMISNWKEMVCSYLEANIRSGKQQRSLAESLGRAKTFFRKKTTRSCGIGQN